MLDSNTHGHIKPENCANERENRNMWVNAQSCHYQVTKLPPFKNEEHNPKSVSAIDHASTPVITSNI